VSLRNEQYRSIKRTRQFLSDILLRKLKTPKEIREAASCCIKHFPFLDEHGRPYYSQDPFGPDEVPELTPLYKETDSK
jgi:hypothetical protein